MSLSATFTSQFEAVFVCSRPLPREAVRVRIDRSFNRTPNPSLDHTAIEQTWNALTHAEGGSHLYNKPKFRLHRASCSPGGDTCELDLGLTDYKSNIGTTRHLRAYAELAAREKVSVEAYLSNALGVESMATTLDGHAVLFRRSAAVGEYAGCLSCPGGHAEPDAVLPTAPIGDEAVVSLESIAPSCVAGHIFDAAVMEVVDELGVPREACRNMGVMSVIRNAANRKPDVCFWIDLQLPSRAVKEYFDSRRGADAFESVSGSLLFVDLHPLTTEEAVSRFVAETLKGEITPASLACLMHGHRIYHDWNAQNKRKSDGSLP